MDTSISFEQAIKRLEEIVRELESGEIEIEKALSLFEEGTKLTRICAKKLAKIEKKIEILRKGKNGEDVLELFEGLEE
ncbi:MAG: exodeoxyribonuclease VII small subunit [Spirochaetes bacterium]|nr:MAG: exodeoxyribonuclease VII small subunit [Spirochaetota bacterium]